MDMIERRGHLTSTANPDKKLDYIVTLKGHLPNTQSASHHIALRYVPDRDILDAKAFGNYLDALSNEAWENPEDLAVTVLTDVNNEIVARWVQVSLRVPELQHHAISTHAVIIEDRQPGWDNAALLQRLERI